MGAGISCGRIAAVPMANLPYEGPVNAKKARGVCSEPEVSVRPVLALDVTGTECLVPMMPEAPLGAVSHLFMLNDDDSQKLVAFLSNQSPHRVKSRVQKTKA